MSQYVKNPGNCYQHAACVCYRREIAQLKDTIRLLNYLVKTSVASVAAAEKKKVSRPRRAQPGARPGPSKE